MATRSRWMLTGICFLGQAWGCSVRAEPGVSNAETGRGGGSSAAAAPSLPAAAGASGGPAAPAPPASTSSSGSEPPLPVSATNAYPGRGFVLHEWGTNTVVSASDGTLEFGLHHEEEDLPAFVYDRMKVSSRDPNIAAVKMETPIAYFYSDVPRQVSARVNFPRGILTQWYPATQKYGPPIPGLAPGLDGSALKDPALDPSVALNSQHCVDYYRSGGVLDWGTFALLAPFVAAPVPEASLQAFSWSYAREVAANFLQFPGGESERFLFYRGVSNVEPPARVESRVGGVVRVQNLRAEPLGAVFALDVSEQGGAFVVHTDGVAGLSALELQSPEAKARLAMPEFLSALSARVTEVLERSGLYRDEAVAMVNTWRRQWFHTPGLRVLYLAPPEWTDATIPLTVSPTPDVVVRTMVMRVELLTPELEAEDVAALSRAADNLDAVRAYFGALGRFAEPRLRRALSVSPSAAGSSYLEELRHGVDHTTLSGE